MAKKIKKSPRKKFPYIVSFIAVGVLIAGGAAFYMSHRDKNSTTNGVDKNVTQRSNTVTTPSNKKSASGTGSVAINDVTPPSNNDPYPIANEHYRIEQISDKQYDITLYAIINSPSQYDDYVAQLKQYKHEALSYLTTRYGDISSFTITWNPPNAKDL